MLILLTLLIIGSACITGVICKYIFDLNTPEVVGLIAGALTSTPGLAAAIDSTQSSAASIGYGIAYLPGYRGYFIRKAVARYPENKFKTGGKTAGTSTT